MPAAHQTPARAKPRQQSHHTTGLHPRRFCVALRTLDTIRQNPQKDNRRRNEPQHEQPTEDEDEQRSVGHQIPPTGSRSSRLGTN